MIPKLPLYAFSVLFLWAVTTAVPVYGQVFLSCRDVWRAPLPSGKENIQALFESRLQFSDPKKLDYTVRLTGNIPGAYLSRFHAHFLKQRVGDQVAEFIARLKEAGFKPQDFIYVLVALNPEAAQVKLRYHSWLKHKEFVDTPQLVWAKNATWQGQWWETFLTAVRAGPQTSQRQSRVLILPPSEDGVYHFALNPFVLAHELAHATANPKSHLSLIWHEARADYLACWLTGETDFVLPAGITYQSRQLHKPNLFRSLKNELSSSAILFDPHMYHRNSNVISSILWHLGQKVGEQRVLDFIRWMDQQEAKIIPLVVDKEDTYLIAALNPQHVRVIDRNNPAQAALAISLEIKSILTNLKKWAKDNLDLEAYGQLLELLQQRGF